MQGLFTGSNNVDRCDKRFINVNYRSKQKGIDLVKHGILKP